MLTPKRRATAAETADNGTPLVPANDVPIIDRATPLTDEEMAYVHANAETSVRFKKLGPDFAPISDATLAKIEPYAAINAVAATVQGAVMSIPVAAPADPAVMLPKVIRDAKGARIEWNSTCYPVSDKWADAFTALVEAGSGGCGLTIYVDHTRDAIKQLRSKSPELASLLVKLNGNKGYKLRIF